VKLDYPRTKGLGLLGVVLKGIVTVSPSEGAALAALDPWSAFSAPGTGLTLAADPSGGSVLLVAYPLEGSLDLAAAAVRKSEKAVFWDKRPGTFAVEDLERVERLSWAQDTAHAWVGFEQDRSPKAYLGLLLLGAELPVAEHHHEDSWEVIVPLQGAGTLALKGERVTSNASAPRSVDVRAGQVIMIPPRVAHAYQPAGQQPLLAVQLFVPPGPQQRYRDLARPNRGAP
jgi:mannose-6-phosphate isomerase-like protein (cupin superfamily)